MDTVADAVEGIVESSRQVMREGQKIAKDLDAIEKRALEADWRARMREHPVLLAGAGVVAGIALWRILR